MIILYTKEKTTADGSHSSFMKTKKSKILIEVGPACKNLNRKDEIGVSFCENTSFLTKSFLKLKKWSK